MVITTKLGGNLARPLKSREQQLRAWDLFRKGLGTGAIVSKLEQEFHEPVSRRTVERWIEGFKVKASTEDSSFQWYQSEDLGIPWEATKWLLEVWVRAMEGLGIRQLIPTARQVKWWYRVHQVCPNLDHRKLAFIAQRFVAREVAHEVLGEPLQMDDLSAWLSYRGWEEHDLLGDLTYHQRYLQAVGEGRIPRLRSRDWAWDLAIKVDQASHDLASFMFTLESFGLESEHPELLPDRQLGIIREKEAENG